MRKKLRSTIAAMLTVASLSASPVKGLDSKQKIHIEKSSLIRDMAYQAAGAGMYTLLMGANYPSSTLTEGKLFNLPFDWKKMESENKFRIPYRNWSQIDYGNGLKAKIFSANAAYLPDSEKLFDDYFTHAKQAKNIKENEKKKIEENEDLIRKRAVLFLIAYDNKDVQPVYYPGDYFFHGGNESLENWVENTPEEIKGGKRTDYKFIQNSEGLLALINGTFVREDNTGTYTKDGFTYGGFGFDFVSYFPPEPNMATAAIYEDGEFKIASYKNLPNKDKIRSFVQNQHMVLEDFVEGKGANPRFFTRFSDNIARSYIFKHKDNDIGYMWTMYTPPQITAEIAKRMGIKDMMLLDIHSPVACHLSNPGKLKFASVGDFRKNSFNFVPVLGGHTWNMLLSAARAVHKNIQNDYLAEAFDHRIGGKKAYFALFRRDSPEAIRTQTPRR